MRGRERMRRMLGTGTGVLVLASCVLAVGAGARLCGQPRRLARSCTPATAWTKDGTPRAQRAAARSSTGDATCKSNERPLVWNLKGPPGPAGRRGRARPAPARPAPRAPAPVPPVRVLPAVRRLRPRAPHRQRRCPSFETSGSCAPPPLCNDDGFEPNDTHRAGDPRRSRHDDLGRCLRRQRRLLRGRRRPAAS